MARYVRTIHIRGGGGPFEITFQGHHIAYEGSDLVCQVVVSDEEIGELEHFMLQKGLSFDIFSPIRHTTSLDLGRIVYRTEKCPQCFWMQLAMNREEGMLCGLREWEDEVVQVHLSSGRSEPLDDRDECPLDDGE